MTPAGRERGGDIKLARGHQTHPQELRGLNEQLVLHGAEVAVPHARRSLRQLHQMGVVLLGEVGGASLIVGLHNEKKKRWRPRQWEENEGVGEVHTFIIHDACNNYCKECSSMKVEGMGRVKQKSWCPTYFRAIYEETHTIHQYSFPRKCRAYYNIYVV